MTVCYIGLGSNLRSPERQLRQAIKKLRTLPKSVLINQSSLYFSLPCGVHAQPPYCNMVLALNTTLPPQILLSECQVIEKAHDRARKKHWGPRTLDIDLLLYGTKTIHEAHLNIPHSQMLKRDFVLLPLLEIAPKLRLPNGGLVSDYLKECQSHLI